MYAREWGERKGKAGVGAKKIKSLRVCVSLNASFWHWLGGGYCFFRCLFSWFVLIELSACVYCLNIQFVPHHLLVPT